MNVLAMNTVYAAPVRDAAIKPVGYKIVDGVQDLEHPITDPALLADVGFSQIKPAYGTHDSLEKAIGKDDRTLLLVLLKHLIVGWVGFSLGLQIKCSMCAQGLLSVRIWC